MTAPSAYQRRTGRPADESLAVLALPLLALAALAVALWFTGDVWARAGVALAVGVPALAVSAVKVRRFWRDVPRTQPDDPGDEEEIILAAGGAR